MSNLPKFGEYAAAFEETLIDDNWQRLEQYFADDSVYLPGDGTEGRGRDGVIEALQGSVNKLERQSDSRELMGEPTIDEQGDTVTLKYALKYTKAGKPDLELIGTETIEYVDGLICPMEDVFANAEEMIRWRESG